MDVGEHFDPEHAVAATIAGGSASIRRALRVNCPVPEQIDSLGNGWIDFRRDLVYMKERLLTPRSESEASRPAKALSKLMRRVMEPHGGEVFFDGNAEYSRRSDGSWREPFGDRAGPRHTRHPLFLFGPLASGGPSVVTDATEDHVRGTGARRFDVALPRELFASESLATIPEDDQRESDEPILGVLWVDDADRLLRIGERGTSPKNDRWVWKITDFTEYGVDTGDPEPPGISGATP